MKPKCSKCDVEILALTAGDNAGMCAICGRTSREIAWRRSPSFALICLFIPLCLIAFVVWRLVQHQWAWGWALLVLVPVHSKVCVYGHRPSAPAASMTTPPNQAPEPTAGSASGRGTL